MLRIVKSNFFRSLIVGIVGLTALAWAEDVRTWTSLKGSNVDATVGKLDGDAVVLVTKDRREIRLDITDLSLADRQYLVENFQAPEAILTAGELTEPEKTVKIDSATFKKLPDKLKLSEDSSVGLFDQLQTEHFLIAYAGDVRPQVVAEIAERLWHGMAFYHMNFRRDWGEKRRVVFVVEDREAYKWLGKWYSDILGAQAADADGQLRVQQHEAIWEKVGGTSIELPDAVCTEGNFHAEASVFNMNNEREFKKVFTPFPTHCLAGHLLNQQMGGVSGIGKTGYFTLVTGHAYYKEIKLSDKTETHLLDVGGSQGDEISQKSGFDDGTAWPKILKSEVKRGKIKPNLQEIFATDKDNLNPAKLVLVYSLANYLQSNSKRVCAFARTIRRVESNRAIPELPELAKIYGFDTVEAMEADWIEYIKSNDFK
jgi:hypothetical protein